MTGAGNEAFCAGQDLDEARRFDPARSKLWIEEWRILYEGVRTLHKPVVCALNGLAAGSAFQVALLRFLQEGEVKPLGSDKMLHSDVRIIAASNKPVAAPRSMSKGR